MGTINYQTIAEYKKIPPTDLKFNADYQRFLEPSRYKKVRSSVETYGYRMEEVITVNELMTVIDGQHRGKVAIDLGVPEVPVTIKKFASSFDEAKYFIEKNGHNPMLRPIDYWYGRFLAGCPLATLTYQYEDDANSPLFHKISIKGKSSKDTKFTVPQVIDVFGATHSQVFRHWALSLDAKYVEIAKVTKYVHYKEKMDKFFNFFFDCFGSKKQDNPDAYRNNSVRAFLLFYRALNRQNLVNKVSSKKMRQFTFSSDFHRMPMAGQTFSFVTHFNTGRKNKMEYQSVHGEK